MADVKVPPMLHKMSVAAQKAWYKKNKMEYPGAGGKEGRSAAQAKKDVGEINKKKAREAAIAQAAASKKNKELVSSSQRVREMGRRRRESGEGLGGGLETNRDILSYVRAGGTIKAGRLGEETAMNEVTKAEAEKVLGGPVKEKPKMPPGKQPAGYRYVRSLARKAMKAGMKKEEVEQTDEALLPKQQAVADKLKASELAANKEKAGYKFGKSLRDMKVAAKMKKEEVEAVDEKMNLATAKMGDVIKDFQKSDAPQFKGKSMEKRREMAIAAKLGAEREVKEENEPMEEKYMGFKKLVSTIKAKGGARDPEAVAAAIGRKKYGAEKFQAAAAAGKKMSEALDPVGREDKDIDNDGDSDKTDMYLSKRRKAIGAAIRKKVASKMGK
jgi:colicin import membrane protein